MTPLKTGTDALRTFETLVLVLQGMKFLFYFPRTIDCLQDSVDTMDAMSGFSGTHACMFEVMRFLVRKGHDVFQVGMVLERRMIDGVMYVPMDQVGTFLNPEELDVLVQPLFIPLEFYPLHLKLNPSRTRVCIILQCFANPLDIQKTHGSFDVDLVCVSDYVFQKYALWNFPKRITMIPNGIPDAFVLDSHIPRKVPGQWVFHAVYERGGDVAYRIFESVRQVQPDIASKMHVCSYTSQASPAPNDHFVLHGSLPKKALRNLLDQCDYFVYPLVLPNGIVHHDTYGCVIAEALARGVIVVSWDVACNPSLYGDLILQVPHLPHAGYDPNAAYGYNPSLSSHEAIAAFRDAILDLEQHPEKKEAMRKRGIEWAKSSTWSHRVEDYFRFLTYNQNLDTLSRVHHLPNDHKQYLENLKKSGFEPKVIYDIGSCILHWAHAAKEIWPNAEIILFDAFAPAEFLYGGYRYFIGVLGDEDGKVVRFYQNDMFPGGNSYYREIYTDVNGFDFFPVDKFIEKPMHCLDTVVAKMKFPAPDFIKIDAQGSEKDILKGGLQTVSHAKHLIVEMQHANYNEGAPLVTETLPFIESLGFQCIAHRFSGGMFDADYGFQSTTDMARQV